MWLYPVVRRPLLRLPLISTLLLIAFGAADLTWAVAIACAAIVGGAVLASKEIILGR